MTTWTPAAESFFRDFLSSHFGARPADDLAQDLRCHVHEELSQRGVEKVTQVELQRVIEDLNPDPSITQPEPEWDTPRPPQPSKLPAVMSTFRRGMANIFYIALPVITVLLESINHWCAAAFFDPVPTLAHVLLLLSVPAASAWILWKEAPWTPRSLQIGACLSGFACVVSIYYLALTFWWMPFAVIGIAFLGFGLLPLSPLLACVGVMRCRRFHWRNLPSAQEIPWQRWTRRGVLIGILSLALLELPSYVGHLGMRMAVSEKPETRERGLSLIRAVGYENRVLKHCYPIRRDGFGATDAAGMVVSFLSKPVYADDAQAIYFRLHGNPYNAVDSAPAPLPNIRSMVNGTGLRGVDVHQGGDRVGGTLQGLYMDASRIDTHVDAASRLSYTEWTIEFENVSHGTHEARCQVQLPPASVVSRVTLWINGEPEEAAFGPNSQVKGAYRDVVVVKQQDPVLVTMSGPDRALVQCFPVLPKGRMKIRLGLTAPWSADSPDIALPRIVEQNFRFADDLQHHVWAQGDGNTQGLQTTFESARIAEMQSVSPNKTFTEVDLPQRIWSRDPFAQDPEEAVLVGERIEKAIPAFDKIILVLDDSESMKSFIPELTSQLASLPPEKVSVIFSSDVERNPIQTPQALSALSEWRARHGSDNLPALRRAAHLLYHEAKVNEGAVIWLHGPQPALSSPSPLKQAISYQSKVCIYDVTLSPGTNAIAAHLKDLSQFRIGPTMGTDFEERFTAFLTRLTEGDHEPTWEVSRQSADAPIPNGAVKVSDQFPRYTKYLEGMQAWRDRRSEKEGWPQTLSTYQLVTPMSGAVVLERQEQYEEHGLEQVDKKSVPQMPIQPSVPEPSSALLLMLGLFVTALRRKR